MRRSSFVELALNGMADATAFKVCPELKAVGGHVPEIVGFIFRGGGVQAFGAVLLCDLREGIGDDELLGCYLGVVKGFFEGSEFGRGLPDLLAELGVVSVVGLLDFDEGELFCRVVGGADLCGALEGHVLKHVGEAGLTLGVVCGAGVHEGVVAEYRGFGALADDEGEAVGEDFYGGALFKAGHILRADRDGKLRDG